MPDEEPTPRDAPESFQAAEDPPAQTPPAPAPAPPPDPGYTDRGVPTFESVREKIETRYGTSLGAHELASETAEARRVEEQYEARQKAAAERLEQIRKSMKQNDSDEGRA